LRKKIEQHLIEKASSGNADAFSEIYYLLKDSIWGFAYRMTNHSQIAEDITQEAFMVFIERPEKYEPKKGSLFSFLCGVARNKVLNHLKKSGTRLETNSFETKQFENLASGSMNSPFRELLNKEFSEKIESCVENLSPFQREVLLLREIEDLSYAEIAGITETNVGIVKGRLYRARRALAHELSLCMKSVEVKNYEVHRS